MLKIKKWCFGVLTNIWPFVMSQRISSFFGDGGEAEKSSSHGVALDGAGPKLRLILLDNCFGANAPPYRLFVISLALVDSN